jgi:propionate CoA-transferase
MKKLIQADAVATLIRDGATIGVSGILLSGFAEEVAIALEKSFLATGHPRDLTLVHGAGIGNWTDKGTHHFGHAGMVTRWFGAHTGAAPNMAHLIEQDQCEAYCLPQGVVFQLYREIAAQRPGILTKVGLGTFVAPRVEGGRMNAVTTKDYVKVVECEGQEYLFYKTFPIDVALIRGTTADENGNVTLDDEALLLEQLPLAQAANNSHGIVIAQAEYLATRHTLHPKHVKVPGVLVDYVVIGRPENHRQTAAEQFNPAFSGDLKIPTEEVPPLPLNERLIVARRAAMELVPGAVVNTGVGFPDGLGSVAAQEDIADLLTLTSETGTVGGEPGVDTAHGRANLNFGVAYNPEALLETYAQFDWYDGRGLDIALLGLAETDRAR